MINLKRFFNMYWFYIAAFFVPLLIAITYCFVEGIWITGTGNIATGDMMTQLIPIAYELWDKIHLHESLSFTWHVMDGIDFGTLIGYMVSPFTLIMLVIPRNAIPDYIQLIMLIKWSLVSLSMTFFFYNTKYNKLKDCKKLVSLFLGLAFALSNGLMSYIIYIQFMDVMICFPILLFMIEKIIDTKKWKLYYIILAYIIFSNSYIALQVCVFLVIWFGLNVIDSDVTEKKNKFFIFVGSSVLAGLTNCIFILNGLNDASGRLEMDYNTQLEYFKSVMINKPYDVINQMFVFNDILGPSDKLPNIYFSVTAALIVLLFPFVKLERKKKIYITCTAIFLIAGYFIGYLNLFWHMFVPPNGVYNRFMYLFIFFMLFMVLLVLNNIHDIGIKQIVTGLIISLAIFAYVFFSVKTYDYIITYIATILIVFFLFIMLIFYKKNSLTFKQIVFILSICGVAELSINAYQNFIYCRNETYYGKRGYINQICDMIDKAEMKPGERLTTIIPTPNIGMIASKNTDAGFISSVNVNNYNLHKNLGMGINSKTVFLSRGASPLVNLIFNIRYGIGESDAVVSDASLETEAYGYKLYKNSRLAGLGYMVDEVVKKWDYNKGNCFDVQNDFVNKAVKEDNIFTNIDVDIQCGDYFNETYECKNDENYIKTFELKGKYGDAYDAKMFVFEVEKDMDLYMYYSCQKRFRLVIQVDEEEIHSDLEPFQQSTYHIGQVKKGQTVSIIAVPLAEIEKGEMYQMKFAFAEFDNDIYDKVYEKLCNNVYDIYDERADYLNGEIDVDKSGIMMTSVPALSGFKAYVDGEEVPYEIVGDTFIGLPLEKGKHQVEFKYVNDVNVLYLLISIISVIIFIVLWLISVYNSKIHNKEKVKEYEVN